MSSGTLSAIIVVIVVVGVGLAVLFAFGLLGDGAVA
jgi:hypothetical protein